MTITYSITQPEQALARNVPAPATKAGARFVAATAQLLRGKRYGLRIYAASAFAASPRAALGVGLFLSCLLGGVINSAVLGRWI